MNNIKNTAILLLIGSIFWGCVKNTPGEPDNPTPIPREGFNYDTKGVFVLGVSDGIYGVKEYEAALNGIKDDLEYISGFMPRGTTTMNAYSADVAAPDTVWVYNGGKAAEFFPSDGGGEFAGAIAIGDIKEFQALKEKNQPMLMANLVSRLYCEKYMQDAEKNLLSEAYGSIGKKYDNVYYSNGTKLEKDKKASPAKDNMQSYLAELTEAYLGVNDYYPMDMEELERFDKSGYDIMAKIWGKRATEPNKHGITMPPASLKQWKLGKQSDLDLYYRKYLDGGGIPLVASRFVNDEAMVQAAYIMERMTSRTPQAIAKIIDKHVRIGIVGRHENITDMPECRDWNTRWPGTNWDTRGRGYGATDDFPIMTCGEENIIKITEYKEMYPEESIMVHEFAHVVYYGLRHAPGETFYEDIENAYKNALDKGLWRTVSGEATYSLENSDEYFAEGVQAWFNTCRMIVNIDGKNTKLKYSEQLQKHDPVLYELISRYMPEEELTGYHFEYE